MAIKVYPAYLGTSVGMLVALRPDGYVSVVAPPGDPDPVVGVVVKVRRAHVVVEVDTSAWGPGACADEPMSAAPPASAEAPGFEEVERLGAELARLERRGA